MNVLWDYRTGNLKQRFSRGFKHRKDETIPEMDVRQEHWWYKKKEKENLNVLDVIFDFVYVENLNLLFEFEKDFMLKKILNLVVKKRFVNFDNIENTILYWIFIKKDRLLLENDLDGVTW